MKWDRRFLSLAELVATWSKDESSKVGAVIVDDKKRVVSLGFNGAPRNTEDAAFDRETKLRRTIHAEANAILFAKGSLEGCSIYVTRPPCSNCAALIVQSGISTVVYRSPDAEFEKRWADSITEALNLFSEALVVVKAFRSGE